MDNIKIDAEYLYQLVKETPNDFELGEKIRAYVWRLKETR